MDTMIIDKRAVALGQTFLDALAAQDFNRLEELFADELRFRALLPPRTVEEGTAEAATKWLQRWFGQADDLQVTQSTSEMVFDRLYLCYRLRSHDALNGWRVIEQQAYCDIQNGRIVDMWLLCSGFRPLFQSCDLPVQKTG